jgi:hypothetical protein
MTGVTTEFAQNPLHFIERDLIVAAVVEAGRAGALVVRHLLRD